MDFTRPLVVVLDKAVFNPPLVEAARNYLFLLDRMRIPDRDAFIEQHLYSSLLMISQAILIIYSAYNCAVVL